MYSKNKASDSSKKLLPWHKLSCLKKSEHYNGRQVRCEGVRGMYRHILGVAIPGASEDTISRGVNLCPPSSSDGGGAASGVTIRGRISKKKCKANVPLAWPREAQGSTFGRNQRVEREAPLLCSYKVRKVLCLLLYGSHRGISFKLPMSSRQRGN